jgi:hypothetical protein
MKSVMKKVLIFSVLSVCSILIIVLAAIVFLFNFGFNMDQESKVKVKEIATDVLSKMSVTTFMYYLPTEIKQRITNEDLTGKFHLLHDSLGNFQEYVSLDGNALIDIFSLTEDKLAAEYSANLRFSGGNAIMDVKLAKRHGKWFITRFSINTRKTGSISMIPEPPVAAKEIQPGMTVFRFASYIFQILYIGICIFGLVFSIQTYRFKNNSGFLLIGLIFLLSLSLFVFAIRGTRIPVSGLNEIEKRQTIISFDEFSRGDKISYKHGSSTELIKPHKMQVRTYNIIFPLGLLILLGALYKLSNDKKTQDGSSESTEKINGA